jgi:hypothetical protein
MTLLSVGAGAAACCEGDAGEAVVVARMSDIFQNLIGWKKIRQ